MPGGLETVSQQGGSNKDCPLKSQCTASTHLNCSVLEITHLVVVPGITNSKIARITGYVGRCWGSNLKPFAYKQFSTTQLILLSHSVCLFCSFVLLVGFMLLGPYPTVLRAYCQLCIQGLFLWCFCQGAEIRVLRDAPSFSVPGGSKKTHITIQEQRQDFILTCQGH